MSVADIRALPVAEKLRLMEILWDDLRAHVDALPVSDREKRILDDRRRAVETGAEPILEWDDVKDKLGGNRP